MKSILVLTSTFPLNKNSSINPAVKNLIYPLSKKAKLTIILPDHPELDTSYIKEKRVEFIKFCYFWPRQWQRLVYGSGILPNLKKNPLLLFEIIPFLLAQIAIVTKTLKSKKIDVVIANWAIPSGLSAAICLRNNKKTKLLTYVHGSDVNLKNSLYRFLLKYPLDKSELVATVSSPLAKEIKKISRNKKIIVIPQGVNTKNYPKKETKPWIMFAGRLVKGKGTKDLIDAFKIVQIKYPEYKLIIIGQGPLEKPLKKYVTKNKIPAVLFLGPLPTNKLISKMLQAKLLVFPSQLPEGLPNILLEAGTARLPILTTNVGGVKDLLDSKTAYFTEPNHNDIAKKIDLILSQYPRAIKKSNTLHQKIYKYFSVEQSAKKLIEVINNI